MAVTTDSVRPSRFRVDTIPALLRPVSWVYGYGLGLTLLTYLLLQRLTIAVEVIGQENLDADSNYIFCHWHGAVPLSLQGSAPRFPSALRSRPHAWMQHPLWYMKPIHVLLRFIGVDKIVLGSTGHDGRLAADELVGELQAGYSTVLLPDGPAGPPRVLKKGLLHIAAQSGVPIVPLRVTASRRLELRSWDRKQLPVPFSTIGIEIGTPIPVTEHTFEDAAGELTEALG